jgi:hypothetical protein
MRMEFPANEKWASRSLTEWRQDTQDWTDEATGETYPATFAWMATFTGQRVAKNATPTATNFYLRARVSGEKGKPLNQKEAQLALERTAAEFDTYADCECSLTNTCRRHGGPNA